MLCCMLWSSLPIQPATFSSECSLSLARSQLYCLSNTALCAVPGLWIHHVNNISIGLISAFIHTYSLQFRACGEIFPWDDQQGGQVDASILIGLNFKAFAVPTQGTSILLYKAGTSEAMSKQTHQIKPDAWKKKRKKKKSVSHSNVTLHHEMSRNVPDGRFHGVSFLFYESVFYAIYNGENRFQIRGLVAELHVFEYSGTTFGTFGKTCFKCWRLLC